MQSANAIIDDPPRAYQCPGEGYTISRSVHLGRLASYYSKCRDCRHRHDTGTLNQRQVKRLEQIDRRVPESVYREEGIAGIALNELSPARVREIAAAFGLFLREPAEVRAPRAERPPPAAADHWPAASGARRDAPDDRAVALHGFRSDRPLAAVQALPPLVILAGDGRWISAELTAAASEGLRWAGADVIDIAAATAPSLVGAIARHRAGGGLLIGNPLGRAHTTGMTFWGADTLPLSSPGMLDGLGEIINRGIDRPVRRSGSLRRENAECDYISALRPYYHALRPLKFVLDTPSALLWRYLHDLIEPVACEAVPLASTPAKQLGSGTSLAMASERSRLVGGPSGGGSNGEVPQRFRPHEDAAWSRRFALRCQVVESGAHFGLAIDGDGELLSFVDERGQPVAAERLLLVIARGELREPDAARVVLEEGADPAAAEAFRRLGGDLRFAPPSREGMCRALREADARWGAGASGRIYFAAGAPRADALLALSMLMEALSQSDRTLSEAVDDALAWPSDGR